MLDKFITKLSGWVKRNAKVYSLLPRVNFKWHRDKRHIPLTEELRDIYVNSHICSYSKLGYFPNLVEPVTLNDLVNWAKLFDQNKLTVPCSDKLGVREYVARTVGNAYLLKVLQVGQTADDFDIDNLPSRFVIKTNHDSGSVIVVENKNEVDVKKLIKSLESRMQMPFGWEQGEWPYSYIRPKLFIEEFFQHEDFKKPPDFKVQCINGSAWFVRYTYGRGKDGNGGYEIVLDANGVRQNYVVDPHFCPGKIKWEKPKNWDQLISLSQKLSRPFQLSRIDFYLSGDMIVVGEITFFPYAGNYGGVGHEEVMSLINAPVLRYRQPVVSALESVHSRHSIYPRRSFLKRFLG